MTNFELTIKLGEIRSYLKNQSIKIIVSINWFEKKRYFFNQLTSQMSGAAAAGVQLFVCMRFLSNFRFLFKPVFTFDQLVPKYRVYFHIVCNIYR